MAMPATRLCLKTAANGDASRSSEPTRKSPAAISPAGKKAVAESSDSTDINLQGIMQADKSYHALINGRVFKVGDKIGRLTIFEISRYRVVVQNHNKEKNIYDIHKGKINRGEK
jgi:hypothetical protein